ncbi:hypothetical protein GCM10020358_08460 [Amorphoplanes nipponensis]|uniref:Uncharacterized protein n=1 Tax=Actinoplanes nipponensis TaxID=135950 RepID=A0A919JFC6_9ACTN|nr:hypothetical protein [Actinoplanes nipponensis]GIE47997.1 hypothetical protein Ani05nite_15310 [Actinoplanes nipponensis]
MWITFITAVVRDWLPELTIVVRFGTAVAGFVVTASLLARRIRRWRRRRARR